MLLQLPNMFRESEYECSISSHQLQDKFKFPVWSLYFDILLGARQYSLCLVLASLATRRFLQ